MSWICVERETVNQCCRGMSKEVVVVGYFQKMLKTTAFKTVHRQALKTIATQSKEIQVCIYIYKALWINWFSIFVLQRILFCLVFPELISTSKGFPFRHQWHSIQIEKKQKKNLNKTKQNNRIKYIILCVNSYNMWLICITNNCHNV